MAGGPMTVGQLEARLRRLVPRLIKRDRQTLLDAVEAIHELATQLHLARSGKKATVRQTVDVTIEPVSDEDLMRDTVNAKGFTP